jgi:hypothetical protein
MTPVPVNNFRLEGIAKTPIQSRFSGVSPIV